jgi:general secretion pathway protein H
VTIFPPRISHRLFCAARRGGEPASRRGGNSQSEAGFILIDLIAALAVAGLITLLALPQLLSFTSASAFNATLTRSVAALKDARSVAISQDKNVAAVFDRRSRTLSLLDQTVEFPENLDINVTTGGTCRSEGGRVEIIFASDGTNCGAVFRFAKGNQITRLRVNWLTGYVEVLQGE